MGELRHDPFFVEGPALVSLSGGRTSAYMLRRILDVGLQPDVHVVFCNTGKEYEETLVFVDEIARRWGVDVKWLEYHRRIVPKHRSQVAAQASLSFRRARNFPTKPKGHHREPGYIPVDFRTASRHGEPYTNFIAMSGLPNPAFRTCTTELKVRVMKRWMIAMGYKHWDMVMGIRADEPRRVAKLRHSPPERWEHEMPLADAGVTEADVLAFWKEQSFDLGLAVDPELGTYRGNCDGCILKSTDKLVRIEHEEPGRLAWWEEAERDTGSVFRRDRPDYKHLRVLGRGLGDADLGDCFCHD